ncbi:TrmJ/YjtD family RNA methyltransferase [Candidatus Woesearchaeota archaeon]|nr:TrmJ/YjtD family RNA methyltransferase [Candidatus Woesearchaeota archaeon]
MKIILIKPSKSGNLGAIARAMANFNFKDLILVNPKCKKTSITAKKRAKHAQQILKNAKIRKSLPKLHTLIATTSQLGTDYNIKRSPINLEQLKQKISKLNKKSLSKIGLVFGPEGEGLSNEEINKCDFVLTIPANKSYPVLNLSHAVAVTLYELSKIMINKKVDEHITLASESDKNQLLKIVKNKLNRIKFSTVSKKQTQLTVWKKIIGKAFLTKREAFALMGFFKKIK